MRHITTSTEALSDTDPFTGAIMAVVRMAILDLRDTVLTHPTMAEGLGPLFSNVPPRLA
jgi:hypothetical protein